jgi:hypothetical protein
MVLRCPRGDCRSDHVLTRATTEAQPHTAPVRTRGKEQTMLNAALGMLAMLPVLFGFAGYVMVSR